MIPVTAPPRWGTAAAAGGVTDGQTAVCGLKAACSVHAVNAYGHNGHWLAKPVEHSKPFMEVVMYKPVTHHGCCLVPGCLVLI